MAFLGEDRDGDGAAALVGLDDLGHRGAAADLAGARRAALVLGDDRDPRARERLGEGSVLAGARGLLLEVGHRDRLTAPGDLLAGGVDDAVEDAHREDPLREWQAGLGER